MTKPPEKNNQQEDKETREAVNQLFLWAIRDSLSRHSGFFFELKKAPTLKIPTTEASDTIGSGYGEIEEIGFSPELLTIKYRIEYKINKSNPHSDNEVTIYELIEKVKASPKNIRFVPQDDYPSQKDYIEIQCLSSTNLDRFVPQVDFPSQKDYIEIQCLSSTNFEAIYKYLLITPVAF